MRRLRIKQFLDELPDGVIVTSGSGEVQFLNKRARAVLGHDLAPDQPLHLRGLLGAEWEAFEHQLESLANGLSAQWPTHMFTADGRKFWAELNARRMDPDQVLITLRLVNMDPWVNPLPEENLTREERDLRLLVDIYPEPAWILDGDANVIYCNKAWLDYTGQTMAEVRGRGWKRALHPDDFQIVAKLSGCTVVTGAYYDITYRLRRADGQYRWQHARSTAFLDRAGKIARWFGTCADVHDQILQREALETAVTERTAKLQEREQRLEVLFEEAPDAYFLALPSGHLVRVNRAAAELTGWTREKLDSATSHSLGLILPKWKEALLTAKRAAKPELTKTIECNLVRRGGEMREVAVRSVLLAIDGTEHVLMQVRDVSERRQLEREILRIGDLERQRVGQELHDGLCQQLVGTAFSVKVLEEILASKSCPEAAMATEIRELLSDLIQQARTISIGLAPVNMCNEGLAMALGELANQMNGLDGIRCEFRGVDLLLSDTAVATHLYRIAQQAVSNAYQHARPKRVIITLEECVRTIVLSIRDDGTGFPQNARHKRGLGLSSMEYRAHLIQATLEYRRGRNGGTQVICTLSKYALPAPNTKTESPL